VEIFNLYNSVESRWGPGLPPAALFEQMPAMRQTLFRGTHWANSEPGFSYGGNQKNRKPV